MAAMATDEKSDKNKKTDLTADMIIKPHDDDAKLSDVFELFQTLDIFVTACHDSKYGTNDQFIRRRQTIAT